MQSPDMESAYNAIVNEINALNTQTLDIDLEESHKEDPSDSICDQRMQHMGFTGTKLPSEQSLSTFSWSLSWKDKE